MEILSFHRSNTAMTLRLKFFFLTSNAIRVTFVGTLSRTFFSSTVFSSDAHAGSRIQNTHVKNVSFIKCTNAKHAASHLPLTHFDTTLPRKIFLNSPLGANHSLHPTCSRGWFLDTSRFVAILPEQTLSFAARHKPSYLSTSPKQVKSPTESKRWNRKTPVVTLINESRGLTQARMATFHQNIRFQLNGRTSNFFVQTITLS